jgi:hypothetical protein
MLTGFLWESQKERDLVIGERTILKWMLKIWDGVVWFGSIWLRIGASGGLL